METKENLVNLKWKPEIYSKLSIAQKNSALKILKVLKIKKNAHILDVGCGDGKISAKLSKIAKNGFVLGLDKSPEMISYSIENYKNEQHPNLNFYLEDAQEISFNEMFDLVFSSFSLQWFKDKNLFFKKAYDALRENGQMCIVTPLGISPELEYATKVVIENPSWSPFYQNFHPNWYFIDEPNLLHLVKENCFEPIYSLSYIQEVNFPSLEDFEEYILLWFPYLTPLNEQLKSIFFSQIINEYCKLLPPKKDGSMIMKIPTTSLIASKINL